MERTYIQLSFRRRRLVELPPPSAPQIPISSIRFSSFSPFSIRSISEDSCGEAMADSGVPWEVEYNEAAKLGEEISEMISKRSLVGSDPESYLFALKRKILVFGTRLDTLEFHLSNSGHQCLTEQEMNRRRNMVADLRSKMYQMSFTSNASTSANRSILLEEKNQASNTMTRATELDVSEIVDLQRQIIRAQDEELEKLVETIRNTNFVAHAINQEFLLHERLIDEGNRYVEVPGSRLQRAGRRLAILNKRTRRGCSCLWLIVLSITGFVLLALVIYMLVKFM